MPRRTRCCALFPRSQSAKRISSRGLQSWKKSSRGNNSLLNRPARETNIRFFPSPGFAMTTDRNQKRDLLSFQPLARKQIEAIFAFSRKLKHELKRGIVRPRLPEKALAMVFEKPSLRTRVSFETGMIQLGGSHRGPDFFSGYARRDGALRVGADHQRTDGSVPSVSGAGRLLYVDRKKAQARRTKDRIRRRRQQRGEQLGRSGLAASFFARCRESERLRAGRAPGCRG